jgi:hypothetical protein
MVDSNRALAAALRAEREQRVLALSTSLENRLPVAIEGGRAVPDTPSSYPSRCAESGDSHDASVVDRDSEVVGQGLDAGLEEARVREAVISEMDVAAVPSSGMEIGSKGLAGSTSESGHNSGNTSGDMHAAGLGVHISQHISQQQIPVDPHSLRQPRLRSTCQARLIAALSEHGLGGGGSSLGHSNDGSLCRKDEGGSQEICSGDGGDAVELSDVVDRILAARRPILGVPASALALEDERAAAGAYVAALEREEQMAALRRRAAVAEGELAARDIALERAVESWREEATRLQRAMEKIRTERCVINIRGRK